LNSPFSKKYWASLGNDLTEDKNRMLFFEFWLPLFLSIISLSMALYNRSVGSVFLLKVTFYFGLINLIIWCLNFLFNETVIGVLTGICYYILLIIFLLYGGEDGFSILWILLVPSFGFLLYGRKKGMILNVLLFASLVFIMWTAPGNSLLKYQPLYAFQQRFPLLYIAFGLSGYLFEFIREKTSTKLKNLREKYYYNSTHDSLTGLFNRAEIKNYIEGNKRFKGGLAIIDIDNFKAINDNYGHLIGDLALQKISEGIHECFGEKSVRWGGDEFCTMCERCSSEKDLKETLEKLLYSIMNIELFHKNEKIPLTVSVGAVFTDKDTEFEELISKADNAIYQAKNNGKNQFVIYSI